MSNGPDLSPAAKAFFENQTCLLVEASQSYLQMVKTCFKTLGVDKINYIVSKKFDEACMMIETHKPRLLLSDFQIEGKDCIALLKVQQKFCNLDHKITIFMSTIAKDGDIAKIAEEEVDTVIIKPISVSGFQEAFLKVVNRKIMPSLYSQKISEGRNLAYANRFAEALQSFEDAKKLHEKPSLACYYTGMTNLLLKKESEALKEFQEGQKFQPFHYKCLMAEFDLQYHRNAYHEAYLLIDSMIKNYPMTPNRLKEIFITAVFAKQFGELPSYFDHVMKLSDRPVALQNIAANAFIVAAKWRLSKNQTTEAMEEFDRAVTLSQRQIEVLNQIILELLKYNLNKEAEKILEKVLPADVGTPIYERLTFTLDLLTLPKDKLVEKARKLLQSGHADQNNFKAMVKLFMEAGKKELAESTITKAVEIFPELREVLYQILEHG